MSDDERASAWLDDELDAGERREVAARIATDPQWALDVEELAQARTLVRGLAMAEPPAGFLESLILNATAQPDAAVIDLDAARVRRRATRSFAAVAAAAAVLIAVVVPGVTRTRPALATDVRVHQAGVSASSDPVSGLAPLGTSLKLGR